MSREDYEVSEWERVKQRERGKWANARKEKQIEWKEKRRKKMKWNLDGMKY